MSESSTDALLICAQDNAWLRSLARRLIEDPDAGDDVAQDAALAALKAAQQKRHGAPWLVGVGWMSAPRPRMWSWWCAEDVVPASRSWTSTTSSTAVWTVLASCALSWVLCSPRHCTNIELIASDGGELTIGTL